MTDARERFAARLAVEQATVEVAELLRAHGIPAIALRGPLLVRLLYDDVEARGSIDVDLLVPDLPGGSRVLLDEGYEVVVDWTPGMERHAWSHVKADAVSVDLHRTLVGIGADDAATWRVFERESAPHDLGAGSVRGPRPALQAVCVALHAAQHGRGGRQTLDDLNRAIARFDPAVWDNAARLAAELDATPALAAGLSLTPEGRLLADRLGVSGETTRRATLRAAYGTSEPAVLALDEFLSLKGSRRVAFVLGKLAPSPEFMRSRHPIASRGFAGLAVAYAVRVLGAVVTLPRGLKRLRQAGRPSAR